MKKDTKYDSQFELSGRNVAEETVEHGIAAGINYSNMPGQKDAKRSAGQDVDEDNSADTSYASNTHKGDTKKNGESASNTKKYGMYDYGSTGERSKKQNK